MSINPKVPSPTASPDGSMIKVKASSPAALDFWTDEAPESGSVTEIADGVYWLRMPLPIASLSHINLYILRDNEGYTVVDTGLGSAMSQDIWKDVFSGFMKGRRINRVICTHLHPDHTGLAGWICREFGAPLCMTRNEYFLCRLMAADTGQPAPPQALEFYRLVGLTEAQIEIYKGRFGGFGKMIKPMPHGYNRLYDGQRLLIDKREWTIITASGHSPEHACLYNEELGLFLSGDQVLPNISSNVSVWPTEPEGNPLQDWIDSCHKLKQALPEDVLVCPAHGIPFRGAHSRLRKLISHHEKALVRLYDFCKSPKFATEVYSCLFRREIGDNNRILAIGESVAHLNCLIGRGLMSRRIGDTGQFTYKSLPIID